MLGNVVFDFLLSPSAPLQVYPEFMHYKEGIYHHTGVYTHIHTHTTLQPTMSGYTHTHTHTPVRT